MSFIKGTLGYEDMTHVKNTSGYLIYVRVSCTVLSLEEVNMGLTADSKSTVGCDIRGPSASSTKSIGGSISGKMKRIAEINEFAPITCNKYGQFRYNAGATPYMSIIFVVNGRKKLVLKDFRCETDRSYIVCDDGSIWTSVKLDLHSPDFNVAHYDIETCDLVYEQ